MNPPFPPEENTPVQPRPRLSEVRFSLRELLGELKDERATGSFAMEKLERHEIEAVFRSKLRRENSQN